MTKTKKQQGRDGLRRLLMSFFFIIIPWAGGQSRWWAFFFLERGCRPESSQLFFPGSEKSSLTCACLSVCVCNDGFLNPLFSFSRRRSCQPTICQSRHRWAASNDGLVYGTLRKKKNILFSTTNRFLDTMLAKIFFSFFLCRYPTVPRTVWLCFPIFPRNIGDIYVQPPSKPKVQ